MGRAIDYKKRAYRPTLLLDFDGVIHSYTSGWQGVDVIPDPPVSYAWRSKGSDHSYNSIDWVKDLIKSQYFYVCIYSSRSKDRKGIKAMKEWFRRFSLSEAYLEQLEFPKTKPAAFLTIDDRAITFNGEFIPPVKLKTFKTWQGK